MTDNKKKKRPYRVHLLAQMRYSRLIKLPPIL